MITAELKEAFVKHWQEELRLRDWDLTWMEVEFEEATQTGGTTVTLNFQSAVIKIKRGLDDAEWFITMLHELIHVRFAGMGFPESDPRYTPFEQGVEMLARAILKMIDQMPAE